MKLTWMKALSAILATLMLTASFAACADSPISSGGESLAETRPETIPETRPDTEPESDILLVTETQAITETEPETTPPVVYMYQVEIEKLSEWERAYDDLCIGPPYEESVCIEEKYLFSSELRSPLIRAQSNQSFPLPIATYNEGMRIADLDITYRVAEPELLEVLSVHHYGVLAYQSGQVEFIPTYGLPEGNLPGFAVRTLAPGVAHLYITVTNRVTGDYFTMQQVIVIEE